MEATTKSEVVDKLLEHAAYFTYLSNRRPGVGEIILGFSEKEREIIETLRAKDFNHRILGV